MKLKSKWVLPLVLALSSLAWYLAWPPGPFPWLLFFVFIPVLYLADPVHINTALAEPWKGNTLGLVSFYFFILEFLGLSWISSLSIWITLVPVLLGSLFHTLTFLFLKWAWNKSGTQLYRNLGSLGFIGLWLILEWFLEHVFSFPWLNLGFGLAELHPFIQWYEYTGVYGGTVWILALNLLGYEVLKFAFAQINPSKTKIRHRFLVWAGILVGPALISFMRYISYEDFKNRHYNRNYPHDAGLVIVQSNISPKKEKFNPQLWEAQFDKLRTLSVKVLQKNTEYLIWPETALEPWHGFNEDSLHVSKTIRGIRHFLTPYKNAALVCGAISYTSGIEEPMAYNRFNLNTGKRRVAGTASDTTWYNAAFQLENDDNVYVYHKQILVPGVEKSPLSFWYRRELPELPEEIRAKKESPNSPWLFLGGVPHYFHSDGKPHIFYAQSGLGLGVLICFESAFQDYARSLCNQKEGAGILVILSNDAWWGNSPGPYQHRDYARILAIENRRSLAQSSNGGISFFMNPLGDILGQIPLGQEGSLSHNLDINEELTFYTLYGDWLVWIGALAFFSGFGVLLIRKK